MLHYTIPFTKREEFEAAWPHLLKVKPKGAPILLVRGPSFWLKDAGVCVHCPLPRRMLPCPKPRLRVCRTCGGVGQAPMTDSPPQQLPSLREATRTWAKVAALSFGGPAGQIAVMHRILVDEKKRVRRAARLRVPKEFRSFPRLRNSGG